MATIIVNATPHAINIVGENGVTIRTIEPSGQTVRCQSMTERVGNVDGIPVTETVYGTPVVVDHDGNESPLPERKEGTIYIVSSLVAQAVRRGDFLVPNESVRDEKGRIIGCKSLGRV